MESYYVPPCPECRSYENVRWHSTLDTRYKWHTILDGVTSKSQDDPWNYIMGVCANHDPVYHYWTLCCADDDLGVFEHVCHVAIPLSAIVGDRQYRSIMWPNEWQYIIDRERDIEDLLYRRYLDDQLAFNVYERHRWFYETYPEFFEESDSCPATS